MGGQKRKLEVTTQLHCPLAIYVETSEARQLKKIYLSCRSKDSYRSMLTTTVLKGAVTYYAYCIA